MKKLAVVVSESFVVQALMTLLLYAFHAAIIGVSLVPSAAIVRAAFRALLAAPDGAALTIRLLLFCLCAAAALYAYFVTGVLVTGTIVRLLTLGLRPGRYRLASATAARWVLYSGVSSIAQRTILPLVSGTFFCGLFFRLAGCRMGRRVRLNSWLLNDAWLLELGDDVIIGGATVITPHQVEDGHLILEPIRVGAGSLVGAHCYLSSGVTVGRDCLIGIRSFLRRGTTIPDRTRMTSLAGLPLREMYRVEKAARTGRPSATVSPRR